MNTVASAPQSWISRITRSEHNRVFAVLWLITFALYLPAAKAGWVVDAAGWLHNIRELPFWDYVNNTQSSMPSLYQFTQLVTYLFYRVFNANPYAWHTLMVTMHAVNSFLFYVICSQLFMDSGIKNSITVALSGVILFTVCPHISEVIVWEAAYHYLQGFLFILIILRLVQKFHHSQQIKYAIGAGILYFLSTYSLEIFYLTPWYVLALSLYYRFALGYDSAIFKKTVKWFFVPQLLLFVLHIIVLKIVYNYFFAHIGTNIWQPFTSYICKPPRYIFHILFLGRFFSFETRQIVYQFIGSNAALIVFYNAFVLLCLHIAGRFSYMSNRAKASVLLFVWIVITQAILLPLAFPNMLWVYFDRYTYFLDAFVYMLLALFVGSISVRFLSTALLSVYGIINLYFTIQVNMAWKHAAYITNRLLKNLPDPGDKIVVLLNTPQNLKGIPMIGAEKDGQYAMTYKALVNSHMPNKMYDVSAYNMNTPEDGAHVIVHNDSLVRVLLNQWGTWWWYQGQGGISYENEDYKLDMADMGHWYLLRLKHPPEKYLLLYQQGDQWKIVNMKKKGEEQY